MVFLFAQSWPETASSQWDSRLEFYSRWIWAPLILLILVFKVREFLRRRFELLFQNVATAEGRYRKPLEPLLLMNAIWIMSRQSEWHRRDGQELHSRSRSSTMQLYPN